MYNPLVSIVIPLYNGSNYVAQAIDCALAQTYQNIEIIVVNDGSTDEGAGREICLSYGDKIRYFEKENGGCASALNYGIGQAQGEFISWLSHDDLYDPEKVAVQVGYYETLHLDPKTTLIANAGRLIDENGKQIFWPNLAKTKLLSDVEMFDLLLFGEGFNGCGLLIPRTYFDQGLYFREDMRFVLDWNLWQKFAVNGANVYVDPRELVSNRMHSQQVTVKQNDRLAPELQWSIAEMFALLKEHKNPRFMQSLFYYCVAKEQPIAADIEAYMQEKHIPIHGLKKWKYRTKSKIVKGLKWVYHTARRLWYDR